MKGLLDRVMGLEQPEAGLEGAISPGHSKPCVVNRIQVCVDRNWQEGHMKFSNQNHAVNEHTYLVLYLPGGQ